MDDPHMRLALSAAIREQGRRSAHPDDIRASLMNADRIIEYLRRNEMAIVRTARQDRLVGLVSCAATVSR
jgi:hypothetical protein